MVSDTAQLAMIRTRFSPPPAWLSRHRWCPYRVVPRVYVRKHGGKFVLGVEDNDQERSTQVSEQAILNFVPSR